jgi:hypothetical protein
MGLGSSKNTNQIKNSYDPQSDCIDRILGKNVHPRNTNSKNSNQNCHQTNPNNIHIEDDPPRTQNTQFSYRNPLTQSPPSKFEQQRNIWKSNSTQNLITSATRPNLRDPKKRPSEDPKATLTSNLEFTSEALKLEHHRNFYSVSKATAFTNRFLMNISNDKLNINLNLTSNMLTMLDPSDTSLSKMAGLRGNPRSTYRNQRESQLTKFQNMKRREIIEYVQESEIDVNNEIEAIQIDSTLLDGQADPVAGPIGGGDCAMRRMEIGRTGRGNVGEGGMYSLSRSRSRSLNNRTSSFGTPQRLQSP